MTSNNFHMYSTRAQHDINSIKRNNKSLKNKNKNSHTNSYTNSPDFHYNSNNSSNINNNKQYESSI
jgi:hypothetical protein